MIHVHVDEPTVYLNVAALVLEEAGDVLVVGDHAADPKQANCEGHDWEEGVPWDRRRALNDVS